MTLHEWLYAVVTDVCYDREYVYYAFTTHFSALCKGIYGGGPGGSVMIHGIKSGCDALVSWRLARRADLIGCNTVELECRVTDKNGGAEVSCSKAVFELSCGTQVM